MPVEVHVSERTGLRVLVAQVPGPLVTGVVCVATEARDGPRWTQDDGLPHVLEHLVLQGSQDFPYRGVLNQQPLGSVSDQHLLLLPPGGAVHAWHDVDMVGFTLTTAGARGFLALLPVVFDHVFFPHLSDAAFSTEVHHVNGQGLDGGVVYEEMCALEAVGEGAEAPRQRLLDALYESLSAAGGYRAVTGGRSERLRQLSNDGVRAFHAEFFRPDNAALVVTGQVDVPVLLARLEGLEAKLLAQRSDSQLWSSSTTVVRNRPWFHLPSSSPPPPPPPPASPPATTTHPTPRVERVAFPVEDEETAALGGQVLLGWLGPSWEDFQANISLRILWLYLADGPASPLYKALVDTSLCRKLSFGVQEGRPGAHYLQCDGVAPANVERVYTAFLEAVTAVVKDAEEEEGDGLDMGRLRALVHREILRYRSDVEEDPHGTLASLLLYTFLYGQREGEDGTTEVQEVAQLKDRVQNTVSRLEALPCREESEEDRRFWQGLVRRTLLDAATTVVVLAQPSTSVADARQEAAQQRLEEQVRNLKLEELAAAGEALAQAREEMERPCPPPLLDAVSASAPPGVPADQGVVLPTVPVCTVRNVLTPLGKTQFEVVSTEQEKETAAAPALPTPRFVAKGSTGVSATAAKVAGALYANGLGNAGDSGEQPLPFFVQWDHVEATNFVTATVWLETSALPDHLRPLLELWLEVLFELPIRQEDGTLWSSEEVARYLAADTVSVANALGTGRSNFYAGIWSQVASISLKVEADKHWLAVRWLRNLLYRTELCPHRVRAAATKLLLDIQGYQRDGMSICSGLMRGLNFDATRSNHATTNFVKQYGVLTAALQRLRTNPLGLLADLAALQEALTQPWNLRVHIVCDVLAQPDPVRPWLRDFLPLSQARLVAKALVAAGSGHGGGDDMGASATSSSSLASSSLSSSGGAGEVALPPLSLALSSLLCPVLESRHLRTAESLNPTGKGLLISSPAIDAGYLIQCAPFDPVADGLSYGSPGYAALLVAMEFLTKHHPLHHPHSHHGGARERHGAAVGGGGGGGRLPNRLGAYEMTCSSEQGLLTLSLYQAGNLAAAYAEAQEVVRGYACGSLEVDPRALAAAKGVVLFDYLDRVWTGSAAAQQSFLNYFRGTPPSFCADTMRAVQRVAAADVVRVVRQHVLRLFDVTRTSMVASCPSSQALSLKFDLVRRLGRPVVESGTIERCLARVAMEEDVLSESESNTSCSDVSYALELLERTGGGGMKGWVGEVVLKRPDRLLIAAAAMAGVAFALVNKK